MCMHSMHAYVCGHTIVTVRTHTQGKVGDLEYLPCSVLPMAIKLGRGTWLSWRSLNWSCLQKAFLSSEVCYFLFSPMAIPVDITQYISQVIFCLQMEPNFSYPYLTPSLCWFMVDHPANRAFHPINQRFSASLNLQGTSSVHRAKVKILC